MFDKEDDTFSESELATDACATVSGRTRARGEYIHQSTQQRTWPKEDLLILANLSSSKDHIVSESSKCHSLSGYDSLRNDSGFLSGANICSDHCVSVGKSNDQVKNVTSTEMKETGELRNSRAFMRLDSGVDVGINDHFSTLSLNASLNNLNSPTIIKDSTTDKESSTGRLYNIENATGINTVFQNSSNGVPVIPAREANLPEWKLYFTPDEDGDTQLHIAVIQGFVEAVYALIRIAPHPFLLDILNNQLQTPLHLAVLTHQHHIVRRLVVSGATVDIRDRNGNTALHLACAHGDTECVHALLNPVSLTEMQNANISHNIVFHHQQQNMEERNYDGQMCIHLATLGNHINTLRHLAWLGVEVDAREGKSGRTALHYAVERGNKELVEFLVRDCKANVNVETYAGYTPYQLALCTNPDITDYLKNKGAIPFDLPDSDLDSGSDSAEEFMHEDTFFSDIMINGEPIVTTS